MNLLLLAQAATTAAHKLHSAVEAPHAAGERVTYGTPLDWAVILAYLVLILGFGSFFGRYTRSTRDFFFSGAKFSWWLIGMSMMATGVGTHSFMKYAQAGYQHGMSSSMSYMNDWFFIPLFMFGWLPIIYFSRVRSIPEYFQRRFNTPARFLAVLAILEYMIGYIGFNLYTLGTAASQVLGIEVWQAIVVIAVVSGIYVTAGGQTAVIFTDLAQGFMLLLAGLILLVLGLDAVAFDGTLVTGLKTLWATFSLSERLPFAHFSEPQSFNFIGIFWQDGIAGSLMFLFVSQGVIMRFLAAKSVNEGRKCILFNTAFLLPLSMIVVSNAGWIGHALVKTGLVDAPHDARDIFVVVAESICRPGVFGFVLAALAAALMSTIDTLTNATASLFIYDIYQPYLRRSASDRHYMRAARWSSAVTSAIGLGLGLFFARMGSDMYRIHGTFQAFVTPPIVATVFLGAFWKRFTSAGAIAGMAGGMASIWLSKTFPVLVRPFAHGVQPAPDGGYVYMTACFGLACTAVIGIVVSFFTRPKSSEELAGLWVGSIDAARRLFKGAEPSFENGRPIRAELRVSVDGTTPSTTALSFEEYQALRARLAAAPEDVGRPPQAPSRLPMARLSAKPPPDGPPPPDYPIIRLSIDDMQRLKAHPGDLLYVADARPWLGGLRSAHCRAGVAHREGNAVLMAPTTFHDGDFRPGRPVRVEKFF